VLGNCVEMVLGAFEFGKNHLSREVQNVDELLKEIREMDGFRV